MASTLNQTSKTPIVWILKSQRAGENTQLDALARALGWSYQSKQLVYRPGIPYFLLSSSLLGIDAERSELSEPWPDLIISASAKNEPVCRWIRKHANKTVQLIHIGRPWAKLKHFDLVVTTPQYRLPKKHNVQTNTAPMHYQINSDQISNNKKHWQAKLSKLPGPYTALMIGGHSGPYSLDKRAVKRLAQQVNQMVDASGGSLLVSTSARTPGYATDYLETHLAVPKYFHRWGLTGDNPYYAFLSLAESIIVSGDSVSMLCEACAMMKPVYIFDLGEGPVSMRVKNHLSLDCLKYYFNLGLNQLESSHLQNVIYRLAMWKGPIRLTRDLSLVHQSLIEQKRAVWLGDNFADNQKRLPFQDVSQTVDKIKQLMKNHSITDKASDNTSNTILTTH